jgi:hypothetical protein
MNTPTFTYLILGERLGNASTKITIFVITYNGCFFKFGVEVGVNALYRLRITDQLWCALNRLSNAYFDAKFKKTRFQ